jgi:hypothetical protein
MRIILRPDRRRLTHLLPGAIILLALVARLIPGPRTIDDAYITFRYARNILAGSGFVYNPGEHVLGTTTPLYTILLTAIAIFTGGVQAPYPLIALIVNALADAGTCALLWKLGKQLHAPWAGLGAALVWAIAPYSVTFAIGGLETSLYIFLLTATISVYLERQYRLAAFLAALTILTRPDAAILIGPLVLDRLIEAVRIISGRIKGFQINLIEISAFSVPLLAWITFATFYFGSPLPHSITAKTLAYRLAADEGLIRLMQHYATPFMDNLSLGTAGIVIGLFLYPFLSLIGIRSLLRENIHIWPFLLYPWFYFAIFAVANPLIFRWYLTPPLPAYILSILAGAERIMTDLLKRSVKPHPGFQQLAASPSSFLTIIVPILVILVVPFSLSMRGWILHPDHGSGRPAPDMAWFKLELLYRQAAEILSTQITPNQVVAAGDVGVLGYFTRARILDTVGLNSRQTERYYPLDASFYVTNYAIPPGLILNEKPDYLVILEVYGRKGLLKDPGFLQEYQLLNKIPTDIYGSDGLLIYRKKPSA